MTPETFEDYIEPESYDVLYSWYRDDVDFYLDLAKRSRGPVLEAGCGTGRLLLPALQAGVDIDGFDLHPGMLAVLKRKAAALGLAPRVYEADMRDVTLPRRYALITIPFRAFQHLLTTADQLRALRCLRDHLESGGALVMNLWYPSFERIAGATGEPVLEREFPHPETALPVVIYATHAYDRTGQTLRASREVVESDARGYAAKTHRHALTLRWSYRHEIELLLRTAGFTRCEVAGGFDGRPLARPGDEMIWTAWKD